MTVARRTHLGPSDERNDDPAGGLLTAPFALSSRPVIWILIRSCVLAAAAFALTACSTYQDTVSALDDTFQAKPAAIPKIDLTNARWQKLAPDQPDSNPVRVALVARDEKIGATRVVLKVPPSFPLPPFWLTTRGTYSVLQGTFVFDGVDADGKPDKLTQGPGSFAIVPPNLIQRGATAAGAEGLLYITVYGDWAPAFAEGAWAQPNLRAGS